MSIPSHIKLHNYINIYDIPSFVKTSIMNLIKYLAKFIILI